jgi:cysteine desulfurase/selenocysteine lyase
MKPIYLDNGATTFPKPQAVIQAVTECITSYAVNPLRGTSGLIDIANKALDDCRVALAEEFSVSPNQVIYTPSATYAINLVLKGFPFNYGDVVYSSPLEHNAVSRCLHFLQITGRIRWNLLPIDSHGCVKEFDLVRQFSIAPPALVVVSHASNVTGDILPVDVIARVAHQFGGLVLLDAAQTVGLHTPSTRAIEFDFAAFSSHKGLYGIQGAGGLVIKHPQADILTPLAHGGTGTYSEQLDMPGEAPDRFEAGTHSLPAIVSMHAGLKWILKTGKSAVRAKISSLCDYLETELLTIPGIRIHGRKRTEMNVGMISFQVDGFSPQEVALYLSNKKISVRAGLHCAPLAHKALGTLPYGTIRVSPGFFNEQDEIEEFVRVVREYVEI